MRRNLLTLAVAILLAAPLATAQTTDPALEDEIVLRGGTSGTTTDPPATDPGDPSGSGTTQTTDEPATGDSDADRTMTTTDSDLPSTAGPLPLLALSGIAAIVVGIGLSRRDRRA